VRLYDAATGKEGPAFTARGEISALVFRPDSKRVASGDSDGMIMSWAVPD
jgi:WD40 repeat protein